MTETLIVIMDHEISSWAELHSECITILVDFM